MCLTITGIIEFEFLKIDISSYPLRTRPNLIVEYLGLKSPKWLIKRQLHGLSQKLIKIRDEGMGYWTIDNSSVQLLGVKF